MSDLNYQIGIRIADLRRARHITQEQLAEKLDISVKHCSAVERGVSSLSLEKLVELCDILDTNMDFLIRGNTPDGLNRIPPSVIEVYRNADEKELQLLNEYMNLFRKIKS